MSHDNLLHAPQLRDAIAAALSSLSDLFAHWLAEGRIDPSTGSPGDLAYALMAPVALTRVLWLHAGASPQEIDAAREQAARHADLFITAIFRTAP